MGNLERKINFKDGTSIIGSVITRTDTASIVKTDKNKYLLVNENEIVSYDNCDVQQLKGEPCGDGRGTTDTEIEVQ